MATARSNLFRIAQWAFAAAVVWYAIVALRGQWDSAAAGLQALDPAWGLIAVASAIVFSTYVLLIETWRRIVVASGETLRFRTAARIWFVSNLGKYVPGKVWSIAAMTMMARDNSVSPVVAAGSSVLVQIVTIAAGIGVVLVAGTQAVDQPLVAAIAGLAILALMGATPILLPSSARLLSSLTGRNFSLPRISHGVVWAAAAKSAIAWIAYGIAFQLFVYAILGRATGATSSYVAVYAASYIIGFLALFAPGGAVVRESAMIAGLLRFGLTDQADALAIAVASRLWLTLTELLPGLVYLALNRRSARTQ